MDVLIRPCDDCGDDNPESFKGASKRQTSRIHQRWLCNSCYLKHSEKVRSSANNDYLIAKRESNKRKRELELLNGAPLSKRYPSYRCVADPTECFLGSYMTETQMDEGRETGVYPSGSLWLNDHTQEVFEVLGLVGEHQDFLIVGPKRLRLMESRFPRLRRALCNPAVS